VIVPISRIVRICCQQFSSVNGSIILDTLGLSLSSSKRSVVSEEHEEPTGLNFIEAML